MRILGKCGQKWTPLKVRINGNLLYICSIMVQEENENSAIGHRLYTTVSSLVSQA